MLSLQKLYLQINHHYIQYKASNSSEIMENNTLATHDCVHASAFLKTFVFRPSTLIQYARVVSTYFQSRFRKAPFSLMKASVFHRISVEGLWKRVQKYTRFQTKTD